ncbi:MAG: hypothetical protein GEU95_01045 [Rhizobiales bacterium]|nr:hypothetical protein [Hyphomicrobiales bacterium]
MRMLQWKQPVDTPPTVPDDVETARAVARITGLQRDYDHVVQMLQERDALIEQLERQHRLDAADWHHEKTRLVHDAEFYRAAFVDAERDRAHAVAANRYALKMLMEADEHARASERERAETPRDEPRNREGVIDLDEGLAHIAQQFGADNRQQEQV